MFPAQSSQGTGPAQDSTDTVRLNWIFSDSSRKIDPLVISVPRNLYEGPSQNCQDLFVQPLRMKCKVLADADGIVFWKTRNPLLIEDAATTGWTAPIGSPEDLFDQILFPSSFACELVADAVSNNQLVHLVLTIDNEAVIDRRSKTEEQYVSSNKKRPRDDEDILDRWKSKRLKSAIPSLADLPGVLDAPLTDKISINQSTYTSFFCSVGPDECSDQTIQTLFKIGVPHERLYGLISAISDSPPQSGTKNAWIFFWDNNIRRPLELLIPNGTTIRNSNQHTQTRNLRPDFGFLLSKVCAFRGEETGPENQEDPRAELANKLNWVYDPAPYMLGYCCSGPIMTLVALTPPTGSQGNRPGVHDLATFNLRWRRDRINSMRHLINLATILPMLPKLVRSPVDDFQTFERTNSTVEITSTLVVKTYKCEDAKAQVEHLQQVYATLADKHVPNTDILVFAKDSTVRLSPRGSPLHPQSDQELRECLVCVLEALTVAHTIPLYHRDIRWNNVIRRLNDPSKWFIIDWEDAASPPTKAATSFATSSHSPAIFRDGHGVEVDIWGVGHLIRTCTAHDISMELKALGESICRESDTLRAEDILRLITEL